LCEKLVPFRLKKQNKENCKWKLDIEFMNLHRMGLHHEVWCPKIAWKVREGGVSK
jgi:hypothetical protein